ncbi:hypothetical protein [Rhizobium leguminosarum]|uniref:hypothetical protein n=1 Tax=Rhizobium leguminosarum TaxID=384 RepID=UPI003F9BFBCD
MKPENIEHLRTIYKHCYHSSVDSLPDGWVALIDDFLLALEGIGDLNTAVSIRFERGADGLRSFVFPEASRWHPQQDAALRVAQRTLYGLSQQSCETCGNPGAMEDGHVWCPDHAAAAAAKVRRAADLYAECRTLFPPIHGNAINLDVPDHLFDLVANTLRSILKAVERYDIIGNVMITRVEIEDGALFVRVRYTDLTFGFIGAQIEINEMIADLEMLTDEATRKHNLGGSDAP